MLFPVSSSSSPPSSPPSPTNAIITIQSCRSFAKRTIQTIFLVLVGLLVIYRLLAWPPLHWFYEPAPPAGPGTIYLPGGGFSGFWFHLGYLQSMRENHYHRLHDDYEYYCFSSACLVILTILMNHTVDTVMDAALLSQQRWQHGNISRFDLVPDFLDTILMEPTLPSAGAAGATGTNHHHHQQHHHHHSPNQNLNNILPKIQILVTTGNHGVDIVQATNREELVQFMIQTTWVPGLTGWGFLWDDHENNNHHHHHNYHKQDMYLDGGFSRYLHPPCEYQLELPVMWETLVHTFTPSLTKETVRELWKVGYQYEYGFEDEMMMTTTMTTTVTTKTEIKTETSKTKEQKGFQEAYRQNHDHLMSIHRQNETDPYCFPQVADDTV